MFLSRDNEPAQTLFITAENRPSGETEQVSERRRLCLALWSTAAFPACRPSLCVSVRRPLRRSHPTWVSLDPGIGAAEGPRGMAASPLLWGNRALSPSCAGHWDSELHQPRPHPQEDPENGRVDMSPGLEVKWGESCRWPWLCNLGIWGNILPSPSLSFFIYKRG